MSDRKLVWTDKDGDLRKAKLKNKSKQPEPSVNKDLLELKLRRLTSGKGRTVIEVSGLPKNKNWCKDLAKDIKKSLGVGGTYKDEYIEIHGEKIEQVTAVLDKKSIKWKKIGG